MKRLFLLLVISTPLSLISQPSVPFIEEGKVWSCFGDYFFLNVKYTMGEDTLINNKTFKKVLAHGSDVPFNFDINQAQYKSAIRENNGIIAVIEKNFISEHILYNFNKTTGDTVRFYRPIGDFNQGVLPYYTIGKVYKTDNVVIQGISRKRLFIHDPFMVDQLPAQALGALDSQADIWIEGLGGKTGLFSRMPEWGVVGSEPSLLTCVEINGNLVYLNNQGYDADANDPCFIIPEAGSNTGGGGGSTGGGGTDTTGAGGNDSLVLNHESIIGAELLVYPNPAQSEFFISKKSGEQLNIKVYSTNGQEVMNKTLLARENKTSISTGSLSKGLYFITLVGLEQYRLLKLVVQ